MQGFMENRMDMFSPRPWGWSGKCFHHGKQTIVFPAPVGMVRPPFTSSVSASRFPRAHGDGPSDAFADWYPPLFSPRAWGWSEDSAGFAEKFPVIPTLVGMVRDLWS